VISAPRPANEAERLGTLRRHRLYITGREPEFERVARQVSDLFGVPIALVSLVLDDEQHFMGACGPGFIEEHRLGRVELGRGVRPGAARFGHVGAVLLGRAQPLFLALSPRAFWGALQVGGRYVDAR
jgi:hypothetical protein